MLERILPHNMSGTERAVRVILGLVLLSLTVVGPRTAWGYIGIVPLLTGLVGSCPLYAVFGFSTLRRAHARRT